MRRRPPIAGHTRMRLLRTGACAGSVWTLLTEQGVRFPRNLCAPVARDNRAMLSRIKFLSARGPADPRLDACGTRPPSPWQL
jgi:hypothetical protein